MNDNNPRAIALALLTRCEHDRLYSNLALDTALRRHSLSDADRALLTRLFYGVIERKLSLDYIIGKLSSRLVTELDTETLILLRMGVFQLRYMDRIPAHAALNETVALASRRSRGFVNAVLREHTRTGDDIRFPDKNSEPIRYLSLAYSVPEELCSRFADAFGFSCAESILAASLQSTPLTLRVNTTKTTTEALSARLTAAGYTPEPAVHAHNALRLHEGGNPTALPGFADGEFFVQDEASILCAEAVDAREGMTVLDICACPGSKTFGMAIHMNNRGTLRAYDLHKNKLSLIRSGAERLGLDCITVDARDGRTFDPALEGCADRVLCDVPCSGYGVLAKKPEIRYKPLSEAAPLPDIQLAIAENACRYVKVGGVLLYSTCTLLPEENEKNIARFLQKHPNFTPVPFRVGNIDVPTGMLTLRPDEHGTDGFFMAKLVRND